MEKNISLELVNEESLKNKRYYNTYYRKKLISKIDKLKDKTDYTIIYNLIVDDIGNNFSSNRNGIFVNMNLLSDDCICEINNYLSNKYDENPIKSEYVFEDYSSKKNTKKNIKLNYH